MGAVNPFNHPKRAPQAGFVAIASLIVLGTFSYFLHQTRLHPISSPFIQTLPSNHREIIPNIVHYVWNAKNPSLDMKLGFELFLTIYSSYIYFQPEKIYLHTDAYPEIVERAKRSSDTWTRLITNLPFLEVHYVATPTHTKIGKEIRDINHRSEFIRTGVLEEIGGVYMNLDVFPLRDVRSLRESGFGNIFGETPDGTCNFGIMLCKKGTALFGIMKDEMHNVFNGAPETHSTILLTSLANKFSAFPNEVLIMGRNAFRSNTGFNSAQELFEPHLETDTTPIANNELSTTPINSGDAMRWWESRKEKPADWVVDYSSSSFIQASSDSKTKVEGWDGEITLEYVLERRSNYALAAYPAIAHAIKAGYLEGIAPIMEID